MRIHILYFQSVRHTLGLEKEVLELPDGSRVSDALAALRARHPALGPLAPSLALAVNQERADSTHLLSDNDTLALLPPFSGG